MDIQTAKQIRLEEYLHSLGYSPVKRQGINLWYKSPFREETEASFKVNTERNQWYDFALGKGGNIIALASHFYATNSVPYLLKRIEEQAPHVRPVSFSFRNRAAFFSSLARLLAGKGDKSCTGEKRMQGGTVYVQRQAVLRHCVSQHVGRL